jgi:hypothetical protein
MPTYARGQIVVEDMVGVYHCIARCVRSGSPGPDRGAAGAQSIELGGNRARLRSTIQAGGGPIELTRRCRGTPLAALVPGQGGRSNRLCVGHWLDTEP